MTRKFILATALVFGMAGAAAAEGLGDGQQRQLLAPVGTAGQVVGGGEARLVGGGTDEMVVRSAAGGPVQAGRLARLVADGSGNEVQYLEQAPQGMASRTLWMSYGSTAVSPQG